MFSPQFDIHKNHTVSHVDKRRRGRQWQLRWQVSIYPQENESNAPRGAEAKWQSFCLPAWTVKALRINTKEHNSLGFSFSGYIMFFLLFRIHFKAMWNLLNKWKFILEEDLSKYLHIRRREQEVVVLEVFFHQKLSKSITH